MTGALQRIDARLPDAAVLARAAERMRRGLLVAYPTETFYGLGCDARLAQAVDRVFVAKGRPDRMALPLIVGGNEAVVLCARNVSGAAHRLMAAFWPGPLTLVLEAAADLPPRLLGGGATVGVRVSPHPVAAALARLLGGPMVATSANLSGSPAPLSAAEVQGALGDHLAMILDAGPTTGGSASTVLDVTVDPPRLIRSGAIGQGAIEQVLGHRLA